MSLTSISPAEACAIMRKGAVLIDIREADEFAREKISGARNMPLSKLSVLTLPAGATLIFHCKGGNRTSANAGALVNAAGRDALVLEGGIDGWKAAGLPVSIDSRQPLEMMRQVQIAAGTLVIAGAALGFFLNPQFYALSAAVGAGLMVSGITGTCAMARMLKSMPWNRSAS